MNTKESFVSTIHSYGRKDTAEFARRLALVLIYDFTRCSQFLIAVGFRAPIRFVRGSLREDGLR
jgi:hypothetical protein